MNVRALLVAVTVVAATLVLAEANRVEARGLGSRVAVRLGIGGRVDRPARYYGPGFFSDPRDTGAFRTGSTQYERRPSYFFRRGPYEYYRPARTLYRTR